MRTQFTHELIALTNDLTLMCRVTHDAVERVVDALVDADLRATYEVFALDEQLQKMYGACEARTVALLALQAPVARDLRQVMTSIQIAGELSRIGALSSLVADRIYHSHPGHVGPPAVLDVLAAIGRLAAHRTALAGAAVAGGRHTGEPGALLAEPGNDSAPGTSAPVPADADPPADDDTPARLQLRLRTLLTGAESRENSGDSTGSDTTAPSTAPTPAPTAIDLALLADRLGRCVEHTDRIARLIRFLDTGVPPTAQAAESSDTES